MKRKKKNDVNEQLEGDIKLSCPLCGIVRKTRVEFEPGETLVNFTFRCPRPSCGATRQVNLYRGQMKPAEDTEYL